MFIGPDEDPDEYFESALKKVDVKDFPKLRDSVFELQWENGRFLRTSFYNLQQASQLFGCTP